MEHALVHTTLQAATQFAAAGHYDAASTLLDALEAPTRPLEATLLQAKMLAQQGRYAEAIAHWQQVLAVAPDHREAQQGLHLAQRLQTRGEARFLRRANLYYGLGALASLVLLLGLAYLVGANVSSARQQQRDAAVISQHNAQLIAYLETQQQAVQAHQQHSMQAMAQFTHQQEALYTQTLAQLAKIVLALEGVPQVIQQTHSQTTATLSALHQQLAVLSSSETEQQAQQADNHRQLMEVTYLQQSLITLTTLVNKQHQQLTAYLEAQRQTCPENQP